MVIATGMATLGEIEQAVETVRGDGNDDVVLLHCVSIYPPDYESIHLRNIPMLREAFDVPVGFSDHTLGTSIPLAAIALGACIIEKHFTLDKDMAGWDHAISADPAELRVIVEEGRNVFDALGGPARVVTEARDREARAVPPQPRRPACARPRSRARRGRPHGQAPGYGHLAGRAQRMWSGAAWPPTWRRTTCFAGRTWSR